MARLMNAPAGVRTRTTALVASTVADLFVAHPVVNSVSNDHEVQDLVDAIAIRWFHLDARESKPTNGLFVAKETL